MKIIKEPSWDQNTFILEIDNKLIVIDPGYNYKRIVDYLGNKKPNLILITHFHFDHVATVNQMCEHYKIKAYIQENDYELLLNNSLAEFFGFEKIKVDPDNIKTFKTSIDVLPSLKVILAPGHSEGSTLYQVASKLFTGDVLFTNSYGRVDFEGTDPKKMVTTLTMIKNLDGELHVYPGHGKNDKLVNIVKNNNFFDYL